MLTPSLYPRCEFEKAINLQTVLNELIHNVAHDVEFLKETLASTIMVDDFTAALFKIYETILAEGATQVSKASDIPIIPATTQDDPSTIGPPKKALTFSIQISILTT